MPERRGDRDRADAARRAGRPPGRTSCRRSAGRRGPAGSRSISSSEMPPSIATAGQQDLVGPAAGEDLGEVRDEQRAEVDREAPRVVQREPARHRRAQRQAPASPARAPTRPSRRSSCQRARGRIGPRTRGRAGAAAAGARTATPSASAPGASGPGRSAPRRRSRARRRRSTGCPLTNEPFVLPRSSRYQLRPRKVSTACSAEANGSSMTIALLTSRPSVVMTSSPNDRPTAGSPAGDSSDDQATGPLGRLAGRRPQVAQQRADDPGEEQVEQERGRGAGRPTGPA